MARVRWLTAKWPVSLRAISAKMKAAEFKERSKDGFIIERAREALVEGQYIEKRLLEDVAIDPFGKEERTTFIDYRRVMFRLSGEFPQIQVWEAPRNVQGFLSRLAELNRFALGIGPLEVDVIRWSEVLARTGDLKVEVTAIQAGEIAFQDGVVGRVFLRGAQAQNLMRQLVKNRRHRIERAVVQITNGRKSTSVQLCKDGAASLAASAAEGLVERVRESLSLAVRR
jgi:hypothetical protein